MGLPQTIYDADGVAVRLLVLNASGRQSDLSGAPRLIEGEGAPTTTAYPAGSVYLRRGTGGVYVYDGSAWSLLEAGGVSVDPYRIVSSLPYTVAATDEILEVRATGTLTIPAPTSRRRIVVRARGGSPTLSPVSGQIEDFTGTLGSSLVLPDGTAVTLRGNGSNWIIFPS